MKTADLNIQQLAHDYGKYITFQDENRISNTFVGLKRILNLGKDFGIGDFILKYPKTPANLLARALDYSPAGFIRSISILNKPFADPRFRRREFILALSRAITGTIGLTGLGSLLYSMGAVSGSEEKHRGLKEFKAQQTGERNYQVNISAIRRFLFNGFSPWFLKKQNGDLFVTYDWAQPIAISIAAGANIARSITEERNVIESSSDIAYESLNTAINTLIEQPLVRGVRELLGNSYSGNVLRQLTNILVDVPASFTPTFLSQISQYTDNNRRISYDPNPLQNAINKVIYKIPFVRTTLYEMYKTFGDEVAENYKDGSNTLFNVFFNPAFVSKYSIDPDIQMILEPYEIEQRTKQIPKVVPYSLRIGNKALSQYGIKTEKPFETFRLKPEDISDMQKIMSEDITKSFRKLSMKLSKETMEQQERELAKAVDNSYQVAKDWFYTNRANKYMNINIRTIVLPKQLRRPLIRPTVQRKTLQRRELP